MRVVITGGRDYDLTAPHWSFLDKIHAKYAITELIQGGASGADAGAKLWALRKGIDVTEFLCNWVKHDKAGGPLRNQRMVEYLVYYSREGEKYAGIEFPGMAGTKDCHDRLIKYKVHIFTYKGPASQKIT